MVGLWKPNCSRELNGSLIPNSNENPIIVDLDDNAEEENVVEMPPGAYQLLPSDMIGGLYDSNVTSDDSNEENDNAEDDEDSEGSSNNDDSAISGAAPQLLEGVTGWVKEEIQVDCEEIKSLMSNFRLPQSSIPDWASTVPESLFSQYVQSRINSSSLTQNPST